VEQSLGICYGVTCLLLWLIILQLLFLVYVGLGMETLRYGAGAHQWDISAADAMRYAEVRTLLLLSPTYTKIV
jgi:hypothetical protein